MKLKQFSVYSLIGLSFLLLIISMQVVFNPSISLARGYYFTYPTVSYKRNDLVLLCVNNLRQTTIMHHLGLSYVDNECSGRTPYLMKKIVAVPGDVVEIAAHGILVNNHLQYESKALSIHNNIQIDKQRLQKFRLGTDEYYVLGQSAHSYDSRYFGIVTKTQLYNKAILILQHDRLFW